MRKYFDFVLWAVPLVLAPFTVLVMASNGSGPGDLLYPYKRGTEFIILAAASLNPTTKAFFHADLADRRYAEAETLLLARADTAALTTFVDEVQSTQEAINGVSDAQQKAQMTQTLINKIDEYQTKLTKVEIQVANNQATTPVPAAGGTAPQSSQQPSVQNNTGDSSQQTPQSTSRPTQVQSPTTTAVVLTHPSQSILPPSSQPVLPTRMSASTPVVSLPPASSIAVGVAIRNTKDELDKIKEKAKKHEEVKTPEIKKQEAEPTKKPETKTDNKNNENTHTNQTTQQNKQEQSTNNK